MIRYFLENKYHRIFKRYIDEKTNYCFSEVLGTGTYGIAYLIIEKRTGKKYVLKRLITKYRHSKKLRQRFQKEIQILKELNFPFVPSVIVENEVENIPFFVMDYMEGRTFEQTIFEEGHVYSLPESLHILKILLEMVVQIHHKGIVHRDLRIPNVLVHQGKLSIIDFGLATYLNPKQKIEEVKNPKKAANHCSDLYFLGHFLLFLLYSSYTPTESKERSWQEELQLPEEVKNYIERLLLIRPPFSSAEEALHCIPKV
ncbi:protein kinase [Ureibacillus sp. FSL K6-0786]|uniref:serine/threonine protein kinase n=1 Tax=Ureibacillus sp. FSL K6-0786 TaxID=2954607 RepID=UPI0030DD2180